MAAIQELPRADAATRRAIQRLGETTLRYGLEKNDPLAIVAAVKMLVENGRQDLGPRQDYDFKALLIRAAGTTGISQPVESIAIQLNDDIQSDKIAPVARTWRNPPRQLATAGTDLARALFDYGNDNHDALILLAAVQIELGADGSPEVPAPGSSERAEWLKQIKQRIGLAERTVDDADPNREHLLGKDGLVGIMRSDLESRPKEFQPSTSPDAINARWSVKLASPDRKALRELLVPNASPADWPGFLGSFRNGISQENGVPQGWPPKIVWQREVGEGFAPPSVAEGRLFHFDRRGNQARLTCLDAKTGDQLWQFPYQTDYVDRRGLSNGPRCAPLVDGPRVYVYGAEGDLHCLEVKTGNVVWKEQVSRKYRVVQNAFGVTSSPLVFGNLLLVVVGGSDPRFQTLSPAQLDRVQGNGTAIVAFNKETGKVEYESGKFLAGTASPLIATIGGQDWCLALLREGLVGFDPRTGEILASYIDPDTRQTLDHYPWRCSEAVGVQEATPVVTPDGQILLSSSCGGGSVLLQIKQKRFEQLWRDDLASSKKILECVNSTPVYWDGHFYASSGRQSATADLRCLQWDANTHQMQVKWSALEQTDLNLQPTRSSLIYAAGELVCLTEYGKLLRIKATPEKLDLLDTAVLHGDRPPSVPAGFAVPPLVNYPCWTAPVLSHGLLYVQGRNRLVCVELLDPQP